MAIKLPWPGKDSHRDDPYWDFFINTPPADLTNTVTDLIRKAPAGNIFPTKAELHTPEITASHVKGMAQYFGAASIGIVKLDQLSHRPLQPNPPKDGSAPNRSAEADPPLAAGAKGKDEGQPANGEANDLPFAVICAVHADYDPRTSPGIGGQVPVQNGLFITFVLSAWIRELGFRAIIVRGIDADALAAKAGLGHLDSQGRLVAAKFGAKVYVADAIYTDLPLAADG